MKNIPSNDYFRKERVSSKYAKAFPWASFGIAPAKPTRMLSNVTVFDGWSCSPNAVIAQEIVHQNPDISLRGLQALMLEKAEKKEIDYPYVWWVNPTKEWTRAVHEDVNGLPFVKLNNKWHLAYPLDKIAGLVGAQYVNGYEDTPKSGYFILWDNEDCARRHSHG